MAEPPVDSDSERSRRLLFAPELADGRLRPSALARAPVREAARSRRVPAGPTRAYQRSLMRRGALTYESETVPRAMAARAAVLGADALGPPRLLVRVDAFPHPRADEDPARYGIDRFRAAHAVLADAGLPYLLPVTPRPAGRPLRDAEVELLAALRRDAVTFAAHGLDHRTRRRRRPSELSGLSKGALAERLDEAEAALAEAAIVPDVLVPPFDRFDWRQWETLAARYAVIGGGPNSVDRVGYHDTPLWRGNAVWAPAYPPLHGRAAEAAAAVARLTEAGASLWVPIALDWGAESDAGLDDLRRFAAVAAPLATDWAAFLDAVRSSRGAPSDPPEPPEPG
jgi:hypothetical protein